MMTSRLLLIFLVAISCDACRIHFVHRPRRVVKKPVVYLYSPTDTTVNVKLKINGTLTVSEPAYNGEWKVVAHPDGSVTNISDGKHFPYLYWEATMPVKCDFKTGYIIPGDSAEILLRKILPATGLNEKETCDFIEYWLPDLEKNKLNLVSFPIENYEKAAKMEITPKPDHVLRVFMAFKSIDTRVTILQPEFPAFSRTGFYVVEWGGTNMDLFEEQLE